jgi:hypothetical protein
MMEIARDVEESRLLRKKELMCIYNGDDDLCDDEEETISYRE